MAKKIYNSMYVYTYIIHELINLFWWFLENIIFISKTNPSWFIEYGYPLFTEKGSVIKSNNKNIKITGNTKNLFSYLPWKKIRINNGSFWPKVWMLTWYIYLAVHVKNEIPFIAEKDRKWTSQGLHLLCMSFVFWVF